MLGPVGMITRKSETKFMAKETNRFAGFENFVQLDPASSPEVDVNDDPPTKAIAKSKDPNFKRTTLYLSKELHLKLRTHTLTTEQDMSELVEQVISEYFEHLDV